MLGISEGERFLSRRHPVWEAIGVSADSTNFLIFQSSGDWKAGRPSLVANQGDEACKSFVEHGLRK